MKSYVISIFTLFCVISCKTDDFHSVTKIIEAPREIYIDIPFKFKLKLKNKTDSSLQLTLDKNIKKSVHFLPRWYCGDNMEVLRTPNHKKMKNDFYQVDLRPNDSLIFELEAVLKTNLWKDSLILFIEKDKEDFRIANSNCSNLNLYLLGMWIPGNGPFGDSMEGYDFGTKIQVITPANNALKSPGVYP